MSECDKKRLPEIEIKAITRNKRRHAAAGGESGKRMAAQSYVEGGVSAALARRASAVVEMRGGTARMGDGIFHIVSLRQSSCEKAAVLIGWAA